MITADYAKVIEGIEHSDYARAAFPLIDQR